MNLRPLFISAFTTLLLALTALAGPGTLDPTYVPNISGGTVYATTLQPNGELVIAGTFTSVGGTSRNHLARLYSNGTLDTGFLNNLSGANNTVYCAVVEGDGRIVIGGTFTSVNGTTRSGVARLNTNGTLDGSFVPGAYSFVYGLAVQTNNQVIISGIAASSSGGYAVYRLNADGTLDTTFTNLAAGSASANYPLNTVALQSDGKILAGGSFTSYGGLPRNDLVRLNTDGSVDTGFVPPTTINAGVRCILEQPDNKIIIGGDFSVSTGKASSHVVRLAATGALDTNYTGNTYVNGSVYTVALQANNSFLAGGNFESNYGFDLARCYPDGTLDTNFYASFSSTVYTIAIQTDGGILVGGAFSIYGTPEQNSLARVYGDTYPPQFTMQPTNRSVAVGGNVTFSAQVGNPTPAYFQWLKNGAAIPGATDMSYSLYNVQLGDAATYAVAASNALGENTSSNAVLVVGLPPVITQQPLSLLVTQGQTASFTVAATGVPLFYQWRNGNAPIPGATNATLTIASALLSNAGNYTCQLTNFLGVVLTTPATLSVYAPPALLTQPLSQTVGVGSNLTLTVTANGTAPIAYQWWKDGNLVTNQTSATLNLTNVQTTDSGGYSVVLTNSLGSVTSSVAVVSVLDFPPVLTSQPVGGIYLVGTNFTLSAAATGTPPYNWQWNTNGVPIPGANNPVYAVNNAQTNDSGAYTVTVTNLWGGATSSVAAVAVGYAPVILQQPVPFTNALGTSNAFAVTVSGSAPFQYQWFQTGAPLAAGTNNPLIIPALQIDQAGDYFVAVTNLFGATISSNARLTVAVPLTNSPPVIISNQFSFYLTGTPGSTFVVETSTNLQTWQPVATNQFGTNAFLFVDPAATNPSLFYRTHY